MIDISNGTFSSTVNVLARVGSFRCEEEERLFSVLVGVLEVNKKKWCSTTRVMKDVSDNTLDVAEC